MRVRARSMWVIDGYNVLFARRDPGERMDGRELERERDALVSLVTRFLAARSGRAVIVFDGTQASSAGKSTSRPGDRVEVIFSSPGSRADDTIIGIVMHAKSPGGVTVVSSDLEIARAVAQRGATCIEAVEFLRETEAALRRARGRPDDEPIEKSRGISPSEVDDWMKIFGNPPDPDLEDKR